MDLSINEVIAVLHFASASVPTQPPCAEGGCKNATIYLGPRWGSRVIWFPANGNSQVANKSDHSGGTVPSTTMASGKSRYSPQDIDRLKPKHKPIPENQTFTIDYDDASNDEVNYEDDLVDDFITSMEGDSSSMTVAQYENNLFNKGSWDLSGYGINGAVLKRSLHSLHAGNRMALRRLNLSANNISYLPLMVFPLDLEYGLQELRLDHNPLDHLSSFSRFELSRLGNLKVLNLSSVGFKYLDPLDLPRLEVLDLSHNQLTFIPPSSLRGLGGLRVLDFSWNRITCLFDSSFTALAGLHDLSLAYNNLNFVSQDAFRHLESLQRLRLDHNSLTWPVWHLASDVHLSHNPWICSCPLLQAYHSLRQHVVDKQSLTCQLEADGSGGPRPVGLLRLAEVRAGCPGTGSWSGHTPLALGGGLVMLSLLLVGLALCRRRLSRNRCHKTMMQKELPYTILDNKNCST